ncbi:MAG: ribonuclease J [Rhodospirillales bacterium]|nr:ribonuclease J [Rhodospirillales bacterium]
MSGEPGADELVFLPLGGAGEIGMNLNLYGYGPPDRRRWLVVDLGITFASGEPPGVSVITPDVAYLEARREDIAGLLLTHAHEDHLGAVHYLWPRLRCPVYATRFARAVLERKLTEAGLIGEVPIIEVPLSGRVRIGPFDVELVTLTHSIPEPNALAIRTGAGLVVHTGDWKLDPDPVVGVPADEAALTRLGDEGVLAMICDSTNALESGRSGSEGDLHAGLLRIVESCRDRVAVTCFASNIARLQTLGDVATATGRRLVLAGASLKRNVTAARECGYLADLPPVLDEIGGAFLPRREALYVCTGSQGEGNAALSRLASGAHPRLLLEAGDAVIFSARVIPGHELGVGRIHNTLLRRGIRVFTQRDAAVHVSGHPAAAELRDMYAMVRPRLAVPVHGELRHMLAHAAIARECGAEEVVTVENGDVLRLAPAPAGIIENVPSGKWALEGNRLVPLDGNLVRERTKAIYKGVAVATVAISNSGDLVKEPLLSTIGLLENGEDLAGLRVGDAIGKAVDDIPPARRRDDDVLREAIRVAVRRVFRDAFDKKPMTFIHVVRC